LGVKTVPSTNTDPLIIAYAPGVPSGTRPSPAAVVLKTSVDIIGLSHIITDFIKLPEGQGIDEIPGFSSIIRQIYASI
jgi:hypothetical protein